MIKLNLISTNYVAVLRSKLKRELISHQSSYTLAPSAFVYRIVFGLYEIHFILYTLTEPQI